MLKRHNFTPNAIRNGKPRKFPKKTSEKKSKTMRKTHHF
jgi:hypothetical protein